MQPHALQYQQPGPFTTTGRGDGTRPGEDPGQVRPSPRYPAFPYGEPDPATGLYGTEPGRPTTALGLRRQPRSAPWGSGRDPGISELPRALAAALSTVRCTRPWP